MGLGRNIVKGSRKPGRKKSKRQTKRSEGSHEEDEVEDIKEMFVSSSYRDTVAKTERGHDRHEYLSQPRVSEASLRC